jgi:hypothetical protein
VTIGAEDTKVDCSEGQDENDATSDDCEDTKVDCLPVPVTVIAVHRPGQPVGVMVSEEVPATARNGAKGFLIPSPTRSAR